MVFRKMLIDIAPATMQYYQLVTKVIEQGYIVNQTGETIRLYNFVRNKNDKSFFTMRFDIGRGASKPLDKILIATH